jgi:hypothetical protein
MNGLFLNYTTRSGNLERYEFTSGQRAVNLGSRHITGIDLVPIAACVQLESLDLSNNLLQTLDLWPLMRCRCLGRLSLRNNRLARVDVSPLFLCPNLRDVNLDSTVEILADRSLLLGQRRPWPLDELRKQRSFQWFTDHEAPDPLVEIERIKDSLFTNLLGAFRGTDNAFVVDEFLKHKLCEGVENALKNEIADAEHAGAFQRAYQLERGLEIMHMDGGANSFTHPQEHTLNRRT